MADLRTRYLGMELRSPLVASSSPLTGTLDGLRRLEEAGANGLVLFNRFYQPDLDIETMEVLPALELSISTELRLPLRWIAILHRRRDRRPAPGRLSQRSVPNPAAFERANYIKTLASHSVSG